MRLSLVLLLGALVFQSAISTLVVAEDCSIVELQHSDDDCSPLCATCDCGPLSHAFQIEIVADQLLRSEAGSHSLTVNALPPDAPPQEILHVPLVTSTL